MPTHLAILIGRPVRLRIFSGDVPSSFTMDGHVYSARSDDGADPIFYDWILGRADEIVGIELHCLPGERILASRVPLTALDEVEVAPFPRIWFRNARLGEPAGYEAFGDLTFFADAENNLAIVVGLDDWLSTEQQDRLVADVLNSV